METPLHEAKARLFHDLAHPLRVRVLELLLDGPQPVKDLLTATGVTPARLSQQLGILRRSGIIASSRDAGGVSYSLSTPEVTEMMRGARAVLATIAANQGDLLAHDVEPAPE